MASSKKKVDTIFYWIIIFYIFLIPFGQLARFDIDIFKTKIPFVFFDLVGVMLLVSYITYRKIDKIPKDMFLFFLVATFSFVINLVFEFDQNTLNSILYLIRLMSWGAIYLTVKVLITKKIIHKKKLVRYLHYALLASCVLGLFQYFLIPDLRFLKQFGWDDHLNRLTGLYLDPGYMALIALVGFFVSLSVYTKKYSFRSIISHSIFLLTLLFTYSRAGYLAFIFGFIYYCLRRYGKKALGYIFFVLVIFGFLLFLLPRTEGEGVRLERLASVNQRFENYSQTLSIIRDFPLFGVGYNNICKVRLDYFGGDEDSHSCGGSDSSILFVLATTGVLGLFVFLKLLHSIYEVHQSNLTIAGVLISVFVHSMFSNSLFYTPFVGIFIILLAISSNIKE